MNADRKIYLGDSVYAEFDGFNIILTTENGLRTTNKIYIDGEVFENLILYRSSLFKDSKEKEREETV